MITLVLDRARPVRRLWKLENRAGIALKEVRTMEASRLIARLLMRCHRRWEPILAASTMPFP